MSLRNAKRNIKCSFDVQHQKPTQQSCGTQQTRSSCNDEFNERRKMRTRKRNESYRVKEKKKIASERNAEANDDNNFEHSEKILETQSERDGRKRNTKRRVENS